MWLVLSTNKLFGNIPEDRRDTKLNECMHFVNVSDGTCSACYWLLCNGPYVCGSRGPFLALFSTARCRERLFTELVRVSRKYPVLALALISFRTSTVR